MSATPHVFIPAEEIQKRIQELGAQIDADYSGSGPIYMITILKGAFMFLADLARAVKSPPRLPSAPSHLEIGGSAAVQ